MAKAQTFIEILKREGIRKFNPYHDRFGRFTTASRYVQGFPVFINCDRQGKHMRGHRNFISGRSILSISFKEADELLNKYAGTGIWKSANKELVDFNRIIGVYFDYAANAKCATNMGIIHYSKAGAHIVPAKPNNINKGEYLCI